MAPLGSIVDVDELLKVVWVSLASGVGVTAVFGMAILGATRAVDSSRRNRPAETLIFGTLGVLSLAVVAAAIVFGIVSMATK